MPDPFEKVTPGQPVKFSATQWNAFVDAARLARGVRSDIGGGSVEQFRQADIIKIRNDSGSPLGRFSVLGIDSPVFSPTGSAAEQQAFQNQVLLSCITPTSSHRGKFVILMDPVPADGIARAWVAGTCAVLVNVIDEDHSCADIVAGDYNRLQSSRTGSAQMLWRAGGLGEQWAVIRFGATCGGTASGVLTDCDCPEDEYEVDVDCFGCTYGYGPTTVMPKYWIATILDSQANPYAEEPYCDVVCADLAGQKVQLENETTDDPYDAYDTPAPTCVWSGMNGACLKAELSGDATHAILRFLDIDDCVIATLRKLLADFDCCGPNTDWTQDEGDECLLSVALLPHKCTQCCPPYAPCPPEDGQPLCSGIPCCIVDCQIVATATSLATPPGIPCVFGELDCVDSNGDPCVFGDGDCWSTPPATAAQSCGGMNGVYTTQRLSNCVWYSKQLPAGQPTPPGEVQCTIRLNSATMKWNATLEGPDGQVAYFTQADQWDCTSTVIVLDLVLGSSTCLVGGQISFSVTVA